MLSRHLNIVDANSDCMLVLHAGRGQLNARCLHQGEDSCIVVWVITAIHKKIVVVRLGENFTLKRLQVINGKKIFLKSENPANLAIEVSSRTDFEIWGCITYVIHRLTGSNHI